MNRNLQKTSNNTKNDNDTGLVEVTLAKELTAFDGLMIGVGGLIGGGIFSVVGLAVAKAGPAVIITFLLGGVVALTTGVSYVKLSRRYPLSGATYIYVDRAFQNRFLSGWVGWLLFSGYTIICAMYAYSFGAYTAEFLIELVYELELIRPLIQFGASTFLIFAFLGLNLRGVSESISVMRFIVLGKLIILGFFVIIGIIGIIGLPGLVVGKGLDNFSDFPLFLNIPGFIAVIIALTLIFPAFEGLELVPNCAEEMVDPEHNLGKAIYGSGILVLIIYLSVVIVLVGNYAWTELATNPSHAEVALATVASAIIGSVGVLLLSAGALFSTASAFNASLYGSSRLSYNLGSNRTFPSIFARLTTTTRVPGVSLVIISVVTFILTLTGNLEAISSMAAIAFLAVFLFVNVSALKLRKAGEIQINPIAPIISIALCGIAIVVLFWYYVFNAATQNLFLIIAVLAYYSFITVLNYVTLKESKKEKGNLFLFLKSKLRWGRKSAPTKK
ncbi:MAG: APC family permease [Candidatus Hodarchaeota archaeon]